MSFRKHVDDRFKGWIHRHLQAPGFLLRDPERVMEMPHAECLLECEGRRIHRVPLQLGDNIVSCFTYHFTNSSIGRSLRRSPAFRIKKISEKIEKEGLPSMTILAALKRRRELFSWESFLIACEIAPVLELPSQGKHVYRVHECVTLTPEISKTLAEALARFHIRGFFHGDLKSRHVLLHQSPSSSRWQFFFVDLEKCLYLPRLPRFGKSVLASRDLIQLLSSMEFEEDGSAYVESFLANYFSQLSTASFSERWMRRLLELYGPGGSFRQGRTLLANLIGLLRSDQGEKLSRRARQLELNREGTSREISGRSLEEDGIR